MKSVIQLLKLHLHPCFVNRQQKRLLISYYDKRCDILVIIIGRKYSLLFTFWEPSFLLDTTPLSLRLVCWRLAQWRAKTLSHSCPRGGFSMDLLFKSHVHMHFYWHFITCKIYKPSLFLNFCNAFFRYTICMTRVGQKFSGSLLMGLHVIRSRQIDKLMWHHWHVAVLLLGN